MSLRVATLLSFLFSRCDNTVCVCVSVLGGGGVFGCRCVPISVCVCFSNSRLSRAVLLPQCGSVIHLFSSRFPPGHWSDALIRPDTCPLGWPATGLTHTHTRTRLCINTFTLIQTKVHSRSCKSLTMKIDKCGRTGHMHACAHIHRRGKEALCCFLLYLEPHSI